MLRSMPNPRKVGGKTILLVLLLILMTAVLAACGDATSTPGSTTTASLAAATNNTTTANVPTTAAPITTLTTTTTTTTTSAATTITSAASTAMAATTIGSISATQPAIKVEAGFTAPDFSAKTLSGDTLQLSQLRGKAVLLNFWATYCPYCREETPELVQTYTANKDKLTVVGVNWKENEGDVQNFVKKYNVNYPVVLDKSGALIAQFRAPSHPYSVFINPQGVITGIVPGILSPDTLRGLLAKTLGVSGNSTTPATTAPVAADPANSTVIAPPPWFAGLPAYQKAQKLPLDAQTIRGFGLDPTQYYVWGAVTTDTPSTVADFYITTLTGAGWEKIEQTVLGSPDLGQQLFFTRQQDNQRQVVEVVLLSKTGLAANPQTKAAASNLPDGASLILSVPEQG